MVGYGFRLRSSSYGGPSRLTHPRSAFCATFLPLNNQGGNNGQAKGDIESRSQNRGEEEMGGPQDRGQILIPQDDQSQGAQCARGETESAAEAAHRDQPSSRGRLQSRRF